MSALVEALLAREQGLSAVEAFSAWHDEARERGRRVYRDRVPADAPGPGQQYGFEVDLDACTGCKACVAACHSLNGLDPGESFRRVGLLHGGKPAAPAQLAVSTACHHCLEPACMAGCPVGAYEKDPITGIVEHLDDQCIGCRYCQLTCPYDVPTFNAARGIVRKCNMCKDRLVTGEEPACVEACPSGAIAIRLAPVDDVVAESEGGRALPAAPPAHRTYSTTSYVTRRPQPANLLPADYHQVAPDRAHPPLVAFLVLSQLSVGALATALAIGALSPAIALAALAACVAALGASALHLGRPHLAFRAVLGVRTSWLSREVIGFGLYLAALGGLSLAMLAGPEAPPVAWVLAAAVGAASLGCSVMVYAVCGRELWRAGPTLIRFGGSAVVLGGLLVAAFEAAAGRLPRALCAAVAIAAIARLAIEAGVLAHLRDRHQSPLRRSALLLVGPLARLALGRALLGLAGGVAIPALVWLVRPELAASAGWLGAALVLALAGELVERHLFFVTAAAPRMPGGLST